MNRYEDIKIKKTTTKRGKLQVNTYIVDSKATTIYSAIPESDSDIYVITQFGDRLDTLAEQFYEDSSLWWYIAKSNHLIFNNVPVGTILRIPVTLEYARGS